MVNDNSTVISTKLSSYLSNLKNTDVRQHCSLIKKQNGFATSSFAFLFVSVFLGLLLTINVFVIIWSSFNKSIDYNDQETFRLSLSQFETNWLISKILVSFLSASLLTLIGLIGFGYYFNNYKKVDTPIVGIKKPVNFINRINLVCAGLAIVLVAFGYSIFIIYTSAYHKIVIEKQSYDFALKPNSIVSAKTLISTLLGITFCLALISLLASFLVYSVFSVQYRYFTTLIKLTREIIKLNAQTVVEEKVQESTNVNTKTEQIKEEVKVDSNQTQKVDLKSDLNDLFKKFNKQPFIKSTTQTQSVDSNSQTNRVDEATVRVDQQVNKTAEYAQNTQQVNAQANQTQQTRVDNQNPTSSLKDIFQRMNSYPKTQAVNNQTRPVDEQVVQPNQTQQVKAENVNPTISLKDIFAKANNYQRTQAVNNQTGPVEQQVNQQNPTPTTNVNPGDLYKNIFKFKSPLSANNETNSQKEVNQADNNPKPNPKEEDYGIGVKTIGQEHKQKEELKDLFKKIKDSKN
ncbi:hypothetical protein [Mycoplasma tullyi]|uniref:hypothetical protein n=1 Tax=Mycoplasma tullyi TaxID=1612150 RepID=UPI001E3F77B8|nr:hypothetical protein [Mycoplasma tullyi]